MQVLRTELGSLVDGIRCEQQAVKPGNPVAKRGPGPAEAVSMDPRFS